MAVFSVKEKACTFCSQEEMLHFAGFVAHSHGAYIAKIIIVSKVTENSGCNIT